MPLTGTDGLQIGALFDGQASNASSGADGHAAISGVPNAPLKVVASSALIVWQAVYMGHTVLCGTGCTGPLAFLFATDQTLIGVQIIGGFDGEASNSRFRFFDAAGASVGAVDVPHTSAFQRIALKSTVPFRGFLVTNKDAYGTSYDEIVFSAGAAATASLAPTTAASTSNAQVTNSQAPPTPDPSAPYSTPSGTPTAPASSSGFGSVPFTSGSTVEPMTLFTQASTTASPSPGSSSSSSVRVISAVLVASGLIVCLK